MSKFIAIALVLGALGAGAGYFMTRDGAVPADTRAAATDAASKGGRGKGGRRGVAEGPIPVAIAPVTRRDVPIHLDGLGTVQAFNTVTVRPQVGGQLLSVTFREGQTVKAGDLLATIDPRSFEAQLQQAEAQKAQTAAQLETARRDLQRFRELVGDGYVSKQQLDTQVQAVAQLEATVRASEAAARNARVSLGYTRITAPIAGVTGLRLVDAGNIVDAASALVVVTQVTPISVLFTLPEQSLAEIRAAGAQDLKVMAFDRDNRRRLAEGRLTVIDNQIDASTGTIRLKATFANDDRALWPGQFVNARLLVRTEANGVVIPANAVQRGPGGDFVYVVETGQDGKGLIAAKRDIGVLRSEGGSSLIGNGLDGSERIVVDGQYRLEPGAAIREASEPAPVAADSNGRGRSGAPAGIPGH